MNVIITYFATETATGTDTERWKLGISEADVCKPERSRDCRRRRLFPVGARSQGRPEQRCEICAEKLRHHDVKVANVRVARAV